jgi:hypothetical protein
MEFKKYLIIAVVTLVVLYAVFHVTALKTAITA